MVQPRFVERREEHARVFSFDACEVDERPVTYSDVSGAETSPSRGDMGTRMALRVALLAGITAGIAAEGGRWLVATVAFAACVTTATLIVRPYMPTVFRRRPRRVDVRVDARALEVTGGRRRVRVALEDIERIEPSTRLTLVRVDGTREHLAPGGADAALAEALNAEVRAMRATGGGYR